MAHSQTIVTTSTVISSIAQASSVLMVRYPYLGASYNDKTASDVTLCFGNDEKVFAHKVILKGASGVFHTAFNSQLPVAFKTEYLIEGYPDAVVHAMLKYIYGSSLEALPDMAPMEYQIDYFFGIFAIANEYEISSLAEAATQGIFQIMKSCCIAAYSSSITPREWVLPERKKFGEIVAKAAHLYINHDVADKSLMNGVIEACFELTPGLVWLEDNINITSMIEASDPFSGRLLRKAITGMRYNSAVPPPPFQPPQFLARF
ncbi:hypothetical protein KCU85_g6827, partial [Aureobasidium melanogenum]